MKTLLCWIAVSCFVTLVVSERCYEDADCNHAFCEAIYRSDCHKPPGTAPGNMEVEGVCTCTISNTWTYRGSLGPDYWHLHYPHCGGIKQSPIDIVTADVIVDTPRLTPIVFQGYDSVSNVNMTLSNNGHTVSVDVHEMTNLISGGGLPGTFVAVNVHFHWGAVDSRGSEHDINAHQFPMEMHIVHYNQKYGNITNAVDKADGLAILGFFFKIGRFNPHLQEIIQHFNAIMYKDSHVSIRPVQLKDLIPAELSKFYRYEGSLTTPPCFEIVTWTLFNSTIEIAAEQIELFRTSIYENDHSGGTVAIDISDDFRPNQCLGRRMVYSSDESLKYNPLHHETAGVIVGRK